MKLSKKQKEVVKIIIPGAVLVCLGIFIPGIAEFFVWEEFEYVLVAINFTCMVPILLSLVTVVLGIMALGVFRYGKEEEKIVSNDL